MASIATISEGTEALLRKRRSAALKKDIERAYQNLDFLTVERLAADLNALGASSTLKANRSDIDSVSSISRRSCSGRIHNCDRLTVLQAGPLVYFSEEGTYKPMPPINFRWEKEAILKAVEDPRRNRIFNVEFYVASPDRWNAVMADVQNIRILHISCHGMIDGKLAFEDKYGSVTYMTKDDLNNYPGISSLHVVFVSACHSRSIGAALIDAGVKHVVCCTNEAKLKDSAAIEFAAAFYRALASGKTRKRANTLKYAFDLAYGGAYTKP